MWTIRGGHRVSARGGSDFWGTKLILGLGTNLKKEKITKIKEKGTKQKRKKVLFLY